MDYCRLWSGGSSCHATQFPSILQAGRALGRETGATQTRSSQASSTGNTYIYNTSHVTFAEGEQACRDNGGHLVAYLSLEEQLEIEKHFTDYGWWLPYYHKAG